jgi:hypothetical protein
MLMSLDLEGVYTEWLIDKVKRTKNTHEVIKHLRRRQEVRPELALLIANIFEGKVKATLKLRKKKKVMSDSKLSLSMLHDTVEYYKEELRKPRSDLSGETLSYALKQSGYEGKPKSKSEINRAAKLLTCMFRGLTKEQLDESLVKRSTHKNP